MLYKVISLFNKPVVLDALVSFLFLALYAWMVLNVSKRWRAMPEFSSIGTPQSRSPSTTVSIIVPYRNEEQNILRCLTQLSKQNYPAHLFEIIPVDDHSTDASCVLVKQFSERHTSFAIKSLSLVSDVLSDGTKEGKKAALTLGISKSASELILTIDADCSMGENMLSELVAFYEQFSPEQSRPKMIMGPVSVEKYITERFPVENAKSPLHDLQDMEFTCLTAFSAAYCSMGKPFLCNGANLAYQRAAFIEAAGFSGNMHLSSGDDIFLLKKFNNLFPGQIRFLKSSGVVVHTIPQKTAFDFLQQRMRWASKSFADNNRISRWVALRVVTISGLLLVNLLLSIFYGKFAAVFACVFFLKCIVDYRLLINVSGFFKKRFGLKQVLANALLYPLYSLFILFLSMRNKYEWKGRQTR